MNKFFLLIPCHRKPERCFAIHGKPMPICQRCLAMVIGYSLYPIFLIAYVMGMLPHISIWIGVILWLPLIVDGFTQLWKWRTSNAFLRVITGFLFSVGMIIVAIGIVEWVTSIVS